MTYTAWSTRCKEKLQNFRDRLFGPELMRLVNGNWWLDCCSRYGFTLNIVLSFYFLRRCTFFLKNILRSTYPKSAQDALCLLHRTITMTSAGYYFLHGKAIQPTFDKIVSPAPSWMAKRTHRGHRRLLHVWHFKTYFELRTCCKFLKSEPCSTLHMFTDTAYHSHR